jgi:hypothetical protein
VGEKKMPDGWIGVDLDGTLAEYHGWTGDPFFIGKPIPSMVERVKQWIREGKQVWIFTARVNFETRFGPEADPDHQQQVRDNITRWCIQHIGKALPLTYKKNHSMIELWDDRAVQVIPNLGERADGRR